MALWVLEGKHCYPLDWVCVVHGKLVKKNVKWQRVDNNITSYTYIYLSGLINCRNSNILLGYICLKFAILEAYLRYFSSEESGHSALLTLAPAHPPVQHMIKIMMIVSLFLILRALWKKWGRNQCQKTSPVTESDVEIAFGLPKPLISINNPIPI